MRRLTTWVPEEPPNWVGWWPRRTNSWCSKSESLTWVRQVRTPYTSGNPLLSSKRCTEPHHVGEKCGCTTHRMWDASWPHYRPVQISQPVHRPHYMFSDLARLASDFGINVALTNRLIWAMVQGNWTGVQAENFPPVRSVVAQAATTGLSDFKTPKDTHTKPASTIEQWANLTRQQVKLFVALYGTEHSVERLNYIRYLEMLNNTQCTKYPLKWVRDVWAKTWAEYDMQIMQLLRRIQNMMTELDMYMTPQNVRVVMCMPGAQAKHQLFLPGAFLLSDDASAESLSETDIQTLDLSHKAYIKRLLDLQERCIMETLLARIPTNTKAKASGVSQDAKASGASQDVGKSDSEKSTRKI